MFAIFNRFELDINLEDAKIGSHQGDCSEGIEELLTVSYIKEQLDAVSSDDIRSELSEYGAWDEDELSDDEFNKSRILWLACGDIIEEASCSGRL